jgi:multiple sugar transport system ATP-binding protein
MASVAIENVTKSYGAQSVLHNVSVDIPDGSFVVLVGPSGCGKSTLLRMIAGLEDITGGIIRIGGQAVNDLPPKQRDISMVFQNYALYPHMTVAENMAFSLTLAGASKADKTREVERAADILGLKPLLSRYPRALSGGQRQRVAMGRSIVRNPKVFLFDEPLSNLDAKLRVAMRAEIKALHHRLKTTTVYVTHDQVEAMTMADTIVVMQDGHVEQIGSPLDLYDEPDNAFVATFIGSPSMNLIEGTIGQGPDGPHVLTRSGVRLPLPQSCQVPERTPVFYGIRPEHLTLVEASNGIAAEIVVVEPTGSETQVVLLLGGEHIDGVFRERIANCPGEQLHVRPVLESVRLFERDSGRRISI